MKSLLFALSLLSVVPGLKTTTPESVGMDSGRLEKVDSVIIKAIDEGTMPGAVFAVVRSGSKVYQKAYGDRAVVPQREKMTVETVFDLASLSKSVATSIAIMQLVERGELSLTDNVSAYLPDFKPWMNNTQKVDIKIVDLLTHSSGLEAYIPSKFFDTHPENDPESVLNWICTECPRKFRPGSRCLYSCLNFITLQAILETVTGDRLCDYVQHNIFDRLGMSDSHYLPFDKQIDPKTLAVIAPTQVQSDGEPLRGRVHDPLARKGMGGNSGNAGVFSTSDDLCLLSAALLNGGELNGKRILSPKMVEKMFRIPDGYENTGRALGWDKSSPSSVIMGDLFSPDGTVCHTGYTGTSIVLDTESKTAVILLTNRVHPHDKGSLKRTRILLSNIVAASIIQ